MGKSLFTIIFLILSLLIVDQVKTFVRNNLPQPVEDVQVLYPDDTASFVNAYDEYIKGDNIEFPEEYAEELENIDQELSDIAI